MSNENVKKITYANDHQKMFCEHLIRFALSPTISKLEFGGINNIDTNDVSVDLTLNIPTANLLQSIPALYKDLQNEEFKKQFVNDLKQIIEEIES